MSMGRDSPPAPSLPGPAYAAIANGASAPYRFACARDSVRPQQTPPDDILQAVIDARDPEDGSAFSREELVNQISVLFLAGHETSASVLTWCFFILSQLPQLAEAVAHGAFDVRAKAVPLAEVLVEDHVEPVLEKGGLDKRRLLVGRDQDARNARGMSRAFLPVLRQSDAARIPSRAPDRADGPQTR